MTVAGAPVAPLRAIDAAQVAPRIGPFIPDRDPVFVQVPDVGVPAQEPQQLVDDRFDVELLGGQQRESFRQRKPCLRAKHRVGAGAGAVRFEFSFLQHQAKQFVILQHSDRASISLVKSNPDPAQARIALELPRCEPDWLGNEEKRRPVRLPVGASGLKTRVISIPPGETLASHPDCSGPPRRGCTSRHRESRRRRGWPSCVCRWSPCPVSPPVVS